MENSLAYRIFQKHVHAYNLQDPAQVFVDSMHLIETGHHEVNADRDPDLGLHGIGAGAVEGFDPQVLLDPFEEQLDMPPALVDGCDGQRGQFEVVGEESQRLAGFGIDVADTTQSFGVECFCFSL